MQKLFHAKEAIKQLLNDTEVAKSEDGEILKLFLEGKKTITEAINATRRIKKNFSLTPQ